MTASTSSNGAHPQGSTPFDEISRETWSTLSQHTPLPLTADDINKIRGLGDRLDLAEVDVVYRPISRLLNLYIAANQQLRDARATFLHESQHHTPYVIGVAGSVAVGKSTTARLLRELLARWPNTPRVQLVTTDGFLFPNAELERRGLLSRKGFPESYDRRRLLRFVSEIKAGVPAVRAPVYSHLHYDIMQSEEVVVEKPDVVILEGLNVLQPARPRNDGRLGVAISDYFDFSIYVDAATTLIEKWYVDRFLRLRETAFSNPDSYFRRYASLSDEEARATAQGIWASVNGPNLEENVRPSRGRASLILRKGQDHAVKHVLLRKI